MRGNSVVTAGHPEIGSRPECRIKSADWLSYICMGL